MRRLFEKRLQLQLWLALLAMAFVSALAAALVSNAMRHAEGFVLADTARNLRNAIQELNRQYTARVSNDSTWNTLPAAAHDVSLRAISETVLASYPGIEGGYYKGERFLGYSFPTHDGGSPKIDVPESERSEIQSVIGKSEEKGYAEQVFRGLHDVVAMASESRGSRSVWAMKRLPGLAEHSQSDWDYLLAGLLIAALLSAAGVLATGIALHRGVSEIKMGLSKLQTDLAYMLPERRDELGAIGAAVNDLARTRRRLEVEIRREDRLRATGRMVARIAHEMKNPLNSMRLSLEMLAHRLSANKLKSEDFDMAIKEVDRLNVLLSDLLAFQQTRPAQLEVKPVAPLIEQSVQAVAPQTAERRISLRTETNGHHPSALVDEQYVRQVLVNLLLNAIEASPPGSEVSIAVSPNGTGLEIGVCNEGTGLRSEQQEHLFEPFYTTKADGHGLGLAVSREMARSMGGDLLYRESTKGGTEFILQLQGAKV